MIEIKKEIVDGAVTPAFVAFFAYLIRVIVRKKKITFIRFVLDAVSAVFVGIFVGNVLYSYGLPDQTRAAIISLSGMIGPDILAGLLVLTTMFKDSPNKFILKYIYAVRGVTEHDVAEETREVDELTSEQHKDTKK